MDVLVVGSFVMHKDRQQGFANPAQREAHLARFELD
jgi:hypothetical protein